MRSSPVLLLLLFAAALGVAVPAAAKVFLSRAEALELAFPDADRVESRSHFLTPEQVERVRTLARTPFDSKLVTVHTGYRGADALGHAFIDVHTVRTLPEAFLIVLTPQGAVSSLRVLAFHEPLDYLPTERWLEQFRGRTARDELRLDRDVDGIAGATLSARAVTGAVRRALALYQVLLAGG
jgi:hypothetical protein